MAVKKALSKDGLLWSLFCRVKLIILNQQQHVILVCTYYYHVYEEWCPAWIIYAACYEMSKKCVKMSKMFATKYVIICQYF